MATKTPLAEYAGIFRVMASGDTIPAAIVPTLNQNTTGNAATATKLQTARTIGGVSFDGSANVNLPGVNTTGNQNTTGSAATLTTARTINGTSFNGSANITTANWGTARTITIGGTGKSVNGSTNYSWTLAEIGAQAALGYTPVNKAGDTMTGALTVSAANSFNADTPANTQSGVLFNKWNGLRNFGIGTESNGDVSIWHYDSSGAFAGYGAQFKKDGNVVFPNSVYANYTDRLIKSDGGDVLVIKKMTASAYAALGTKDSNTLYVIVG